MRMGLCTRVALSIAPSPGQRRPQRWVVMVMVVCVCEREKEREGTIGSAPAHRKHTGVRAHWSTSAAH